MIYNTQDFFFFLAGSSRDLIITGMTNKSGVPVLDDVYTL